MNTPKNDRWLHALISAELKKHPASGSPFAATNEEIITELKRALKVQTDAALKDLEPKNLLDLVIEIADQLFPMTRKTDRSARHSTSPENASRVDSGARLRVGRRVKSRQQDVRFPKRAAWLTERLRERAWTKYDLEAHRGPAHKTVQKILDSFAVREDVLDKTAAALSLSAKHASVKVTDIPRG